MIHIDSSIKNISRKVNIRKGKNKTLKVPPHNSVNSTVTINHQDNISLVSHVNEFLFLQESINDSDENKNIIEYGHKGLSMLKKLTLSLLSNQISIEDLNELKDLIHSSPLDNLINSDDRMQIIQDINIRIAVEIAKIENRT